MLIFIEMGKREQVARLRWRALGRNPERAPVQSKISILTRSAMPQHAPNGNVACVCDVKPSKCIIRRDELAAEACLTDAECRGHSRQQAYRDKNSHTISMPIIICRSLEGGEIIRLR